MMIFILRRKKKPMNSFKQRSKKVFGKILTVKSVVWIVDSMIKGVICKYQNLYIAPYLSLVFMFIFVLIYYDISTKEMLV